MPRVSPILTNFNGGEWSPVLHGRVDLAKYANACRTLQNFVPLPQGAATLRPGTRFVAPTRNGAPARLIPFQFSTVQTYQIEATAGAFRFYRDRGRIEDPPGVPVEIATPYAEADLAALKWAQSADILYLCHPAHAPRTLARTSHTDWTLAVLETEDGPYLDEAGTGVTIAATAETGSGITLTASAPLFGPGHVGSLWRLGEPSGALPYNTWQASDNFDAGSKRKFAGRVYRADESGNTGNDPPVHTEGTVSDGGMDWTYLHDGWGCARITAVVDATHATADILRRLPGTAPTKHWREGAWSAVRGWPGSVTFHEDRLVFGGSTHQPQTLWASATGDYRNFAPTLADGVVADDTAFTVTISDDRVNAIRWMSSGKVLAIGTSGGEFTMKASSLNEAMTPANVTVRRETNRGVADLLPVRIGHAVLYVQRARRKLVEFAYSFEADAFAAPDMSLLSGHLTRPGLKEIAWAAEPHAVLWCARDDGALVGMTYMRDQQVVAWHRHTLGGAGRVLSVSVIAGAGQDELWLVVERSIGGQLRRTVEVMEDEFWPDGDSAEAAKAEAFYVDSGLSYRGPPATELANLDHLEGATVTILADGATHSPRVVEAGRITLDRPAATVHVGLGYEGRLETLDLEAGAADGTAQSKPKRIARVAVRLWASLGCKLGYDDGHLDRVLFRDGAAPMDASPPLFTGDKVIVFPKGWDRAARVLLVQDQPLPCTVAALMPRLITNDG